MSLLDLVAGDGHEEIVIVQDATSGLRGVVAQADTRCGPAIAPTRLVPEASLDEAFAQAVRLARGVAREAAVARLPRGGAAAVFVGEAVRDKSRPLLAAYARVLENLGGRVLAAADSGFIGRDLAVLSRMTKHVCHRSGAADPAEVAATAVVACIREAAERLGIAIDALHVTVQGLGQVGYRVARLLATEGARLTVADVDAGRVERVQEEFGAAVSAPDEIHTVPSDVFSPNATSFHLDAATAAQVKSRAIVGAARALLADDAVAEGLHERGVLYAPDFVVCSGSTSGALAEDEMVALEHGESSGTRFKEILRRSSENGTSTPRAVAEWLKEHR
jgi:leucine dehydrogenase